MNAKAMIVSGIVIALTAGSAMAQYSVGFTWNRYDDWVPGIANGSGVGNPCEDAAGNPVWSAEYIDGVPAGSDLTSASPWYLLPSSGTMVWDGHWGGGVWAKAYDLPPYVHQLTLGHVTADQSYRGDHYANVPLVTWRNPSNSTITVSLTGGENFQGLISTYMPAGSISDIIIAWTDASDGNSVHLLYSDTISRTLDASDPSETIALDPLSIDELVLDPGDNIIFSVRSRTVVTDISTWPVVTFYDDVDITVVPEPATLGLLGLGCVGLLRRRQRR